MSPEMRSLYLNESVFVRALTLWATGVALMAALWAVSYRDAPEGFLHNKFIVSALDFTQPSKIYVFLKIIGYNLVFACAPIVIANLISVKCLPVGYLLALYHWGLYGVLLGTNSLYFPLAFRPVPSFEGMFSSAGFYEISSYTVIATSTFSVRLTGQGTGFLQTLSFQDRIGLTTGFIMLFLSNLYEAWNI
ncbi:MAG: hypothetical protein QXE22_02715 [Candidatus Bathyarchaeia archaeon]